MSAAKADPVNAVAATKARTAFFMMPPTGQIQKQYGGTIRRISLNNCTWDDTLFGKSTRGAYAGFERKGRGEVDPALGRVLALLGALNVRLVYPRLLRRRKRSSTWALGGKLSLAQRGSHRGRSRTQQRIVVPPGRPAAASILLNPQQSVLRPLAVPARIFLSHDRSRAG